MANRVYLQVRGATEIFDCPLMEDPQFESQSSFSTWGEMAPILGAASSYFKTYSAAKGKVKSNLLNVLNTFDAPRWNGTAPIKMTIRFSFYTKTSAEEDVFNPMEYLLSLQMLTRSSNGKFTPPGISAHEIEEVLNAEAKNSSQGLQYQVQTKLGANTTNKKTYTSTGAKLFALEIPGIIYLNPAYAERCTPIYSKQLTSAGFPLWGTMEMAISGLFPANTGIFDNVKVKTKKVNRTSI